MLADHQINHHSINNMSWQPSDCSDTSSSPFSLSPPTSPAPPPPPQKKKKKKKKKNTHTLKVGWRHFWRKTQLIKSAVQRAELWKQTDGLFIELLAVCTLLEVLLIADRRAVKLCLRTCIYPLWSYLSGVICDRHYTFFLYNPVTFWILVASWDYEAAAVLHLWWVRVVVAVANTKL